MELIAELATAHGGDVALACDMVKAAAEAGAHTVKIQSYSLACLNPKDPQAEWLEQSYLDKAAHIKIRDACAIHGVQFLSTPFDAASLTLLSDIGCRRIKVASSQDMPSTWGGGSVIKSWAWGKAVRLGLSDTNLTAIPLYPTPLEAVEQADLLDGWSDHTVGTAACKHMLSRGASTIEAHFCLPGRSRQMPWDKDPSQLREIRDWMDTVETMTTGVSQHFRERWTA